MMNGVGRNQLLENIYIEHHAWLHGWLRKKLSCTELAADLMQDTFVRLMSSGTSHQLKQPRAYLLVVANRLLINTYRRKKIEEEVLQQFQVLMLEVEQRGPAEIFATRELLAHVILMLTEELDEKIRDAFFLSRLEGKTYKEVSVLLGVSQSSVKQYIAKAMLHFHSRIYD